VIEYKDARIQLLDLPGIIEGAAKGKGRGRQVIGVARTSDLVVMMLDASKAEIQKELLTQELDAVGIRINRQRPNVTIKQKKAGGVSITSTCGDLTHLDVHQVRNILHLYKVSSDFLFAHTYSLILRHVAHLLTPVLRACVCSSASAVPSLCVACLGFSLSLCSRFTTWTCCSARM